MRAHVVMVENDIDNIYLFNLILHKMSHFLKIETFDGKWWRGNVTIKFRYNLLMILLFLVALVAVAAVGFGLYWLAVGLLWPALKFIWTGICWLAGYWVWILAVLLLALAVWGLTKIKWPKRKKGEEKELKAWPFIVLLVVLLIGFFGIKRCSSENGNVLPQEAVVVTPESFNETFDWVVTTRAYLDGVQPVGSMASRALVGFKFVNGEPVTDKIFEGRTYDEAVKVIADDWRELIVESLDNTKLSERQLVAVTLFAMRNGKYGFTSSDFLHELQNGNTKGAETKMALHKANGEKRPLGNEARQYLWVLMQIYNGNIDYKRLLDMPILSYKALPLSLIYDVHGAPLFSEDAVFMMKNGIYETPRAALEL